MRVGGRRGGREVKDRKDSNVGGWVRCAGIVDLMRALPLERVSGGRWLVRSTQVVVGR